MFQSSMKVPLFEDEADKEHHLINLMMDYISINKFQSKLVKLVRIDDILYVSYDRSVFQHAFTTDGELAVRKKYDLTCTNDVRDLMTDYYSLALAYLYTIALSECYLEHSPLFETAARFKETLSNILNWIPETGWENTMLLGTLPDLRHCAYLLIRLVIFPKIVVVSKPLWSASTLLTDEMMLDLVKIIKPKEIVIFESSVRTPVADRVLYVNTTLDLLKEHSPDLKFNRKVVLDYPAADEYPLVLVVDGETTTPYCSSSIFGNKP